MLEAIKQTSDYLKNRIGDVPNTAIILGTGLGELAHEIKDKTEIPYTEIPNFPVSTVEGHSGKLIIGTLGSKRVLAMQGRFHFYEGYNMKQVTFPVRQYVPRTSASREKLQRAGNTIPRYERSIQQRTPVNGNGNCERKKHQVAAWSLCWRIGPNV